MKETMEHTPIPWTPATIINLARAVDVDFAVRAVNNHAKLLEALEAANGMIESLMIDYECPNDHEDCITFKDADHIQNLALTAIEAAKI